MLFMSFESHKKKNGYIYTSCGVAPNSINFTATFNQTKPDELWTEHIVHIQIFVIPVHELITSMDPRICATMNT